MLFASLFIFVCKGDGDRQNDETFLNDLKTTYKICTKENKGSVTLDHLARKYLETHSNEEYKRNLKGNALKVYLVQSSHFAIAKDIVTISEGTVSLLYLHVVLLIMLLVTGSDKFASKQLQDERISESKELSSIEKSACSKPLNIRVHFECGENIEFAKKVKAKTFETFYDEIISTIGNKIPDFKSRSIQFQCGKKWNGLNQNTGFDALCLDEENPEITIQAIKIMELETKHLGN